MTGRLDDLLARATDRSRGPADCWVKAVLTDPSRPASPMERLRAVWPHTLVLDFQPEGERVGAAADLERLARTTDPVEICEYFVECVGGEPSDRARARRPARRRGAGPAGRGDRCRMRLHHLTITAFGPYAGTESIDMDALTASGLFLLEGPTGAGKSTILDAITFALYDRTSGDTSHDDRLHSDFADPALEPDGRPRLLGRRPAAAGHADTSLGPAEEGRSRHHARSR